MLKLGPNKTLYVGVDESNHGRFPEIFSSASSTIREDIQKQENIPKAKKGFGHILKQMLRNSNRDYSFLILTHNDFVKIPEIDLSGRIVGSLLYEEIPPDIQQLKIIMDGEINLPKRLRIKNLVSELCELEKSLITLDYGRDYDRKYPLVNMADGIARYVFRKYTPEVLAKDRHLKSLIY